MYDWPMVSAPWIWPTVAVLATAPIFVQSPEELLRRSDVGAFAPASFRARLVLNSPSRGERHQIEVWRSGDGRTLIRFLDPRERGKYLLRLQGDLWLLTPGAKKPVIPPVRRGHARRGPRRSPRSGVHRGERLA
jgi:hypothetical protein